MFIANQGRIVISREPIFMTSKKLVWQPRKFLMAPVYSKVWDNKLHIEQQILTKDHQWYHFTRQVLLYPSQIIKTKNN